MEVCKDIASLDEHLKLYENIRNQIGLVPTMGALHAGHISLVKKALAENDIVIVSIFVNPTQFNNPNDLSRYPRTLERDIIQLNHLNDDIIVFAPSVKEMYPDGAISEEYNFKGVASIMEEKFRPGHFNGVATVVKRLFEIVNPKRAYFGEKDYQQLFIIKKLVKKEKLPIKIIGCPIVREHNGLAMSSRNERLSDNTRYKASFIYNILLKIKERFLVEKSGDIKHWVQNQFKNQELFKLEYIEIVDTNTLKRIRIKDPEKKYRAFIAVYAEGIRLIDNIALN
ncbi:pantoate--beta-alanine ligase [Leptobacterium sp. I13]|uniref:pantoate--beta-alanine ligase n=1 Tax=Leptobacterium meishanense TaxID=3128904 RepID=UPI0030EE941E